jgi:hypothetical protein
MQGEHQRCPSPIAVQGLGQIVFGEKLSVAALVGQRAQFAAKHPTFVNEAVEGEADAEAMAEAVQHGDQAHRFNG